MDYWKGKSRKVKDSDDSVDLEMTDRARKKKNAALLKLIREIRPITLPFKLNLLNYINGRE